MPNASESRPNALTELVRILRDQLQQKDERIANLEELLADASRKLHDRDREISNLAGQAAEAMARAASQAMPAGPSQVVSAAGTAVLSSSAEPPVGDVRPPSAAALRAAASAAPLPPPAADPQPVVRVRSMPRNGPQVDEIAERIFAAANTAAAPRDVAGPVRQHARVPIGGFHVPAVQRVAAGGNSTMHDEFAKTLMLDRNALSRAHRKHSAASGLQRLLPWRSRANGR